MISDEPNLTVYYAPQGIFWLQYFRLQNLDFRTDISLFS